MKQFEAHWLLTSFWNGQVQPPEVLWTPGSNCPRGRPITVLWPLQSNHQLTAGDHIGTQFTVMLLNLFRLSWKIRGYCSIYLITMQLS